LNSKGRSKDVKEDCFNNFCTYVSEKSKAVNKGHTFFDDNTGHKNTNKFIMSGGGWGELSEEFKALWNGKIGLEGGEESFRKIIEFLRERDEKTRSLTITSCLVFGEKPTHFLMTGMTRKTRKGDRKPIDEKIAGYLPHLTQEEIDQMEPRDREGMSDARSKWPTAFKTINKSMIDKIALIAIEGSDLPVAEQLRVRMGGKTSELDESGDYIEALRAREGGRRAAEIKLERKAFILSTRRFWEDESVMILFRKPGGSAAAVEAE
jgi:hypothetical protein